MAQSLNNLIRGALAEVGASRAGQDIPQTSIDAVTPRIGPLLSGLKARRVTSTVLDSSAIPDELFPSVVRLLAQEIAPSYGKPTDVDAIAAAEARLRELCRLDRTQDAFVLSVLEQLAIYGNGTSALDGVAIAGRLPNIMRELSRRDVIDNAYEPGDLDDEAQPDLARYVAASLCAPPLYAVMAEAEQRLRQMRPDMNPYAPADVSFW